VYQEWSPEGYVSCDTVSGMKMAGLNLLKSSGAEPLFLDLLVRNWNFSGKKLSNSTGLFKIARRSHRTFQKLFAGVAGLF
jgi:hypothetical protein